MNNLKNIAKLKFVRSLQTTKKIPNTAKASAEKNIKKVNEELVPSNPVVSKINLNFMPPRTVLDIKTIKLLERLSLVDSVKKEEVNVLEDAIHFADQILQVNTTGVQPLITVLEDRPLRIRKDRVTEGNIRDSILANASFKEDDYLVSPPGNIPLDNPVSKEIEERHEEPVEPLPNTDIPPAT